MILLFRPNNWPNLHNNSPSFNKSHKSMSCKNFPAGKEEEDVVLSMENL